MHILLIEQGNRKSLKKSADRFCHHGGFFFLSLQGVGSESITEHYKLVPYWLAFLGVWEQGERLAEAFVFE